MLIHSHLTDTGAHSSNPLLSSRAPQGDGGGSPTRATDQLLTQLAKRVPGMSGPEDFKRLDAGDFSPRTLADRITGFVAQGLEQARRDGKSEAEVQALYDQALSGIQQGFDEARKILDDMNLLTDDLAATIDETQQLTFDGLQNLAPAGEDPSGGATTVLAAERYQSAESFSLKVETLDGDKVTIRFNSASDYQASVGGYGDAGGSAAAFSIDRSASSSYRFSVEGTLDGDEIDALQNLVKDMSTLANDFFDGDIQSAFDQSSQFQLDNTELASMHLKLTRSESYSAVAAYQQVQEQGNPERGRGLKLGHLMHDLAAKVSDPALGFLASPLDFGQSLLSGLIPQDSRYQDADADQQARFDRNRESLQGLLASLVDGDGDSDDAA